MRSAWWTLRQIHCSRRKATRGNQKDDLTGAVVGEVWLEQVSVVKTDEALGGG